MKTDFLLLEFRVKKHVFEPSGKIIWTVVGRKNEHWVSPEYQYCSCQSYYFGNIESRYLCYHLLALQESIKSNQYETITFSDEELDGFLSGILEMILNTID